MDEFPPNSNNPQNPEPKIITPIVTTGVTRRKTPVGTKFRETFLSGSDSKGVASYIFFDVIVPSLRDIVADAGTQTIFRILYGDSARAPVRGSRGFGGTRPATVTNYNGISSGGAKRFSASDASGRQISAQARAMHDFDEIVLDSRGEAERVKDILVDSVREYGQATVADLYGLVGITPAHTDHRYGWQDLSGSRVSLVRGGGYLIDLPRPVPLGR